MRPKIYIALWFLLGAIGYWFMYHVDLPDDDKWTTNFIIYKTMNLCLFLCIGYYTRDFKIEERLVVLGLFIADFIDIGNTIANIWKPGDKQEGNYAYIFAHSFGIITSIAFVWLILTNKKSIAEWLKSRLKS